MLSQIAREAGRSVREQGRLALGLRELDLAADDDDIEAGYRAWRRGGSTEEARAVRSELAVKIKRALPALRAGLLRGPYQFKMPTPRTLKSGRVVAELSPIDAIVVAAVMRSFRRHPALRKILPHSYAYAPAKRGSKALVVGFISEVAQAAAGGEMIEVGAADIKQCFPSLSAIRAIEHARNLGFSRWRCAVLEALYGWWNSVPEFAGLVPGSSASCFLSELALRPMDLLLATTTSPYRYSDNIYLIGRGVPVGEVLVEKLALFNEAEGLNLRLHHEQLSTYTSEEGFTHRFEMLGFLLRGHEVTPHPARVNRCRKSVISAETEAEAENIIDGFENYFAGPVPGGVLVRLKEELWSARREFGRARNNP